MKQQRFRTKYRNDDEDLGLVNLENAALFAATQEEAKLFRIAREEQISNKFFLLYFNSQTY